MNSTRARVAIVVGVALAAVVLIGGGYWLGVATHTPPVPVHAAGSPPPRPIVPAPPPPPPPLATSPLPTPTSPTIAAVNWMTLYHMRNWQEPPTAWIDHVRPYITDQLDQQYEPDRTGSPGATWPEFVAAHCSTEVRNIGAVIPPEAPNSATTNYVEVSGTLTTHCAIGKPPLGTDQPQPLAATVTVQRGNDGLWRVSARMF